MRRLGNPSLGWRCQLHFAAICMSPPQSRCFIGRSFTRPYAAALLGTLVALGLLAIYGADVTYSHSVSAYMCRKRCGLCMGGHFPALSTTVWACVSSIRSVHTPCGRVPALALYSVGA